MYDVTRPETFANLTKIWAKEIERYSTNQDCIKILVANKVDRVSELWVLIILCSFLNGEVMLFSGR